MKDYEKEGVCEDDQEQDNIGFQMQDLLQQRKESALKRGNVDKDFVQELQRNSQK